MGKLKDIIGSIKGIKTLDGLPRNVEGQPKVLFFDIETLPAIVAVFGIRGKQNIGYKQILKRSQVMCISWAWNDGKVNHVSMDLGKYDWHKKDDDSDYETVKRFVEIAQSADLVIGHNAREFDVAYLRSRLVKYKLPDFRPNLIDDTYQSTKSIRFMSHKLDDLSDYLGYEGKASHGSGYEWWIDIMRGSKKVLGEMVKYCDEDVVQLRKIYKDLRPYMKSALNMAVFLERPDACPSCGQSDRPLVIRGYWMKGLSKKPKLQCPVCNDYPFTKGKNIITKQKEYNR